MQRAEQTARVGPCHNVSCANEERLRPPVSAVCAPGQSRKSGQCARATALLFLLPPDFLLAFAAAFLAFCAGVPDAFCSVAPFAAGALQIQCLFSLMTSRAHMLHS